MSTVLLGLLRLDLDDTPVKPSLIFPSMSSVNPIQLSSLNMVVATIVVGSQNVLKCFDILVSYVSTSFIAQFLV